MLDGKDGQAFSCVLVDLNTQRDFFEPTGACPVLDTAGLYASLRRIIAWAKRNQVPVVSSLDSHRRSDANHHGTAIHCIEGSTGQSKLPFTLLGSRTFVEGDNTIAVPVDLFRRHQQVIFPQRSKDLFANPKADRFITQLRADEFILFGAVAENEIKAVALGLKARGRRATVLIDGSGSWNRSESELSFRQMAAKGITLLTVNELLVRKLPRRMRNGPGAVAYAWPATHSPSTNGNGRPAGPNGRRLLGS